MLVQGECLVRGSWRKEETIVCHALSTPASCCLACPKGGGRREGKIGRGGDGGRGFLAGHERLSGSQWTKLSNNKVEATVCSASSSSFPFLIHSLSDSCASPAPALSLSLFSPVEPARACSSLAVPFPLFIILAFGNVLPTLQPALSPRLCFNFVWCITLYPPVGQPSPASAPLPTLVSAAFIHLQIFLSNSIQRSLATHTHFYADLCDTVCKQ